MGYLLKPTPFLALGVACHVDHHHKINQEVLLNVESPGKHFLTTLATTLYQSGNKVVVPTRTRKVLGFPIVNFIVSCSYTKYSLKQQVTKGSLVVLYVCVDGVPRVEERGRPRACTWQVRV